MQEDKSRTVSRKVPTGSVGWTVRAQRDPAAWSSGQQGHAGERYDYRE